MIIVLKDQVLFRINRNLSNFISEYISKNFSFSYGEKEKFLTPEDFCLEYNPTYVDLISTNGELKTEIGYLLFNQLPKHDNSVFLDNFTKVGTYYNYSESVKKRNPIIFDKIVLESFIIENYNEADKEHFLWTCGPYSISSKVKIKEITFTSVFCFAYNDQIFKIKSQDLIQSMQYSRFSSFRGFKNKRDIYSASKDKEYYYGETKSIRDLFKYAKILNDCIKLGINFDELDADKFGYELHGNICKKRNDAFNDPDDFIFEISNSKIVYKDSMCYLQLTKDLTSKINPYYRYLIENILSSSIDNGLVQINNLNNVGKETLLGYFVYNISKQIYVYEKYYNALLYVNEKLSRERFQELIGYENTNNNAINKIVSCLLKMEAVDTKRVLYQVGDRDDIEYYDH